MPTFILTLNWTEQGIRAVKDAPKRSQAAKELAEKLGVEVKQVYLTSGERDNELRNGLGGKGRINHHYKRDAEEARDGRDVADEIEI